MNHLALVVFALNLLIAPFSFSSDLPKGASFIGLTEKGWQAFIVNSNGDHEVIPSVKNPREFTWDNKSKRIAYISDAGDVYYGFRNSVNKIASSQDDDAIAQIKLVELGNRLVAIRLIGKKSDKTTLTVWEQESSRFVDIHQQHGKIFDPTFNDDKYYFTVVSCMLDCGGIIQELWSKNSVGKAQQISLHNGIVRYPYPSSNSRVIYSLKINGNYKLWELTNDQSVQLTFNSGSDVNPIVTEVGDVFFIRKNISGSKLYIIKEDGEHIINLVGIKEIRNLELN